MSGSASVPNKFATQAGQVPASQLDGNWAALVTYINLREISSGTLAARPVTPTAGIVYFANDLNGGTLFFGNGSTWVPVTGGISGSSTFVAPITITDATAGGVTHPFLTYQKTGSASWLTYWQKPANFAGSETLSVGTSPASGLQLHLINDPGGQRVAVWDPSNALPNIPHTGILPTMAVYGDVLIGDIVALASNPMTYFIRADRDIPLSSPTQLFSSRGGNADVDGGATIVYYPGKTGGGAVSDGYIQFNAYGMGTGADANEIQFRQRSSSNTVVNRWAVGGAGGLYPKDSNGTLDIGTSGNRIRSLFANSNIFVASGGEPLPKGRLAFCDAGGIAAGQTVFYGPWATNATETNVFIQHIMPFSGVLRNFYAKMTTAAGANQDYKYTVRVNGTSSTIVATMSGVATTASDVTHSVAVNKGDWVTLQVTASAAAAGSTGAAALEIDPV